MLDQLQDSANLYQAKELVLSLLQEHQDGLDEPELRKQCHELNHELYRDVLNALICESRLNMFKKNGIAYFKYISEEQAIKYKDLTTEELLIYQMIEDSGS